MSAAPHIVVRPAREEDFPALWPLLRAMGQTDDEAAVGGRLARLSQRSDHSLLIALIGGQVAGYAWAQDYGPHLRGGGSAVRMHDLYVTPALRKKGVGARLFGAVREWAYRRPHVVWLQWQASQSAVAFYERLGLAGDPCPDPEHPFYEIEFGPARNTEAP
jgi:GNAT superfamily N-acetyltransferase